MVRREAAVWLARLQSGRDPDVQRKFQIWRERDSRNAEAFERVRRSYQQAGLLRESSMATPAHRQPEPRRPQSRLRPAVAAAAAILVLVPVGALLVGSGRLWFAGSDAVMLSTGVGEIRQVALADGSRVTLDTSTKVEVSFAGSQRSARLRYGRARFQIAEAKVPFVVESRNATVTADGGIIDVEQGAQKDTVQVLGGAADVHRSDGNRGSSAVTVGAGESMTINSAGMEQGSVPSAGLDWTNGMLQFDGTPLVEAVTVANRYSKRHIVLAGDLGELKVTGAFRAGDTSGLAKALAAAFQLSVQRRADGALALSRSGSRERKK